jgi:8-oxo-dGTP pyrophosphatase MutT (NUDIX family)
MRMITSGGLSGCGPVALQLGRPDAPDVAPSLRYDSWGWELPGGIIDKDEDGSTTAAQDVGEETGWQPAPLEHVLSFQPMAGMVDTPHEVYAGRGAELVGELTDLEEAARFKWVPMSAVFGLISKGEVLGSGWPSHVTETRPSMHELG